MIHAIKQLHVQLFISISLAFLLGHMVNLPFVSLFYSISTAFIDGLMVILPVMIFSFIFQAVATSPRGSFWLIGVIFLGVTFSNVFSLTIAYLFGKAFLPYAIDAQSFSFGDLSASQVQTLFSLPFPHWLGAEKALAFGMACGIGVNLMQEESSLKKKISSSADKLNDAIALFLNKFFLPFIPLYVFGFCLKLSYDGALAILFGQYGKVFLLCLALGALYLFMFYFAASGWDARKTVLNISSMLPAGLMAFSTMSSAMTMPLTIQCAEKMTGDRNYSRFIIPTTANTHMLGDNLNLLIMAMALMTLFGMPWPDFARFMPFALAFSLAKLSCVGLPGASVLVVLPVLQQELGFTPEMLSLMTTLYILQDPFGTATNVLGNGAFALIGRKKLLRFTFNS